MWGKKQQKSSGRSATSELYYATHYHLIPLYIICGLLIVAVLLMACYERFLWVAHQDDTARRIASTTIQATENLFLPTVTDQTDKKQYVYPSNIRFTTTDPYQTLRFTYSPGSSADKNGASIGIVTSGLLQSLEMPLRQDRAKLAGNILKLEQCSRLYVIRFQPGVTQYGGFSPFKDIKLKDGRTAYMHKNTNCLPEIDDSTKPVAALETTLQTIESY